MFITKVHIKWVNNCMKELQWVGLLQRLRTKMWLGANSPPIPQ